MKNKNRAVIPTFAAAGLILGGLVTGGCTDPANSAQKIEIIADPFAVVAEGDLPPAALRLRFPAFDPPRLLWITGFHAEMIHQDGSAAVVGTDYRTDLAFDYVRHARIHQLPVYHTNRLFTLTNRQTGVVFPEGFGLPFYSDEFLTLITKPIGPSPSGEAAGVRQRITLEYILERNLDEPMKPLFVTSGRWVQSSDGGLDRILRLPYDTRAHYITAPLRSIAGSVELRDLSTGETAYDSSRESGEETARGQGTAYFSRADGIALYQDRPYLLIDDHQDSAADETDSSAAMLLYLRDKLFKKLPRQRAPVAHVEEPVSVADERLLLLTNQGQIEIVLYPEVAPRHFKQIVHLARLGVYDGVQFHRVEPELLVQLGFPEARIGPPLTAEQSTALKKLEAEISDLPMKRWTVAMALHDNIDPDSAVASFFILLDDYRRIDQRYTIVGHAVSGLDTLRRIAILPLKDGTPIEPAFIEKAEVKTYDEILAIRKERLKQHRSSQGK